MTCMNGSAERISSIRIVGARLEACLNGSTESAVVVQLQEASPTPISPPQKKESIAYAPPLSADRQAQLVLLEKVYKCWIVGVLQRTSQDGTMIDINLETVPDAVEDPWQDVVRQPNLTPKPIPAKKPITEIFVENGRSLLILGQPGSGKTMLLLQLAQTLLAQAKQYPNEPIPVVFNLSS